MRWWLTLAAVMAVVTGLWFAVDFGGAEPIAVTLMVSEPPPVVLGVIPYLTLEALKAEIEPVATYLRAKLGRPTRINVAADYESLGKMLDEGGVHLAWFSHASMQLVGRGKPWRVVCRPVYGTRMYYPGAIITSASSSIMVIEQLRGKRFAYVDRYSGSGFYYPNRLFRARGIEPTEFFGSITFTHSHDLSIDGVAKGEFDAAAVFSLVDKKTYRDRLEQFRILAYTGPIPNDPMVVRSDLDPKLTEAVRSAMLTMHVDPIGQESLKALFPLRGTTRFAGEDEVQAAIKSMGGGDLRAGLGAPGVLASEGAAMAIFYASATAASEGPIASPTLAGRVPGPSGAGNVASDADVPGGAGGI